MGASARKPGCQTPHLGADRALAPVSGAITLPWSVSRSPVPRRHCPATLPLHGGPLLTRRWTAPGHRERRGVTSSPRPHASFLSCPHRRQHFHIRPHALLLAPLLGGPEPQGMHQTGTGGGACAVGPSSLPTSVLLLLAPLGGLCRPRLLGPALAGVAELLSHERRPPCLSPPLYLFRMKAASHPKVGCVCVCPHVMPYFLQGTGQPATGQGALCRGRAHPRFITSSF